MYETKLACVSCHKTYDLGVRYSCAACGGILEVLYDYDRLQREVPPAGLLPEPGLGLWRYKHLLPVTQEAAMLTLHEGGTPLIRSRNLAGEIGAEDLHIKDETRNPSGAFKDRPMTVGISKARELGCRAVTTASSGNGAASLAIYAAKASLPCFIFVPEGTPIGKVAHAVTAGANVIKVRGDYSNSYRTAKQAAADYSWMNITTTFLNPYTFEGDKTVAYELFHQLGRRVPDWILIPTGAGPLVYGIFKGFVELKRFGLTTAVPRLAAVQSEGCQPIVAAFKASQERVKAWDNVQTVASAIADPLRGYERDGELILRVIKESRGLAIAVSDGEMLEDVRRLAATEGVYVEPAAAASVSALKRLLASGEIRKNDKVVCLVTGHGLKDPTSAIREVQVPVIEPGSGELRELDLLRKYAGKEP